MSAARVSIVICTRDRAESLRGTLASLKDCLVPPDLAAELVVVDNASRDDATAATVRGAGLTHLPVRCVREETPGLSHARNAGLRAGTGDIFLFTDDDVRVPPRWVEGMCRPIVAGAADAVAGGVAFPPEQARALAREPLRSRQSWFASSEYVDPARPDRLVGANMAFHRRVPAAVGGFDPALGAGAAGFYEETDFCHRFLAAGFRLAAALDPATSVEHHFDLSRLTRATLVSIAARMGRSEACLIRRQDPAGSNVPIRPATLWRARAMLLAARLRAPWNLLAGRTTPAELQRVQTLAFWEERRKAASHP